MSTRDFINLTAIELLIFNLLNIMKAKKYQAGGVPAKDNKAPNKKGAFITVQKRTIDRTKNK